VLDLEVDSGEGWLCGEFKTTGTSLYDWQLRRDMAENGILIQEEEEEVARDGAGWKVYAMLH
jgi:hypothetical protein